MQMGIYIIYKAALFISFFLQPRMTEDMLTHHIKSSAGLNLAGSQGCAARPVSWNQGNRDVAVKSNWHTHCFCGHVLAEDGRRGFSAKFVSPSPLNPIKKMELLAGWPGKIQIFSPFVLSQWSCLFQHWGCTVSSSDGNGTGCTCCIWQTNDFNSFFKSDSNHTPIAEEPIRECQ